MVAGSSITEVLAVAFQWDEVRLPIPLCCSVLAVLLAMLQSMHDPLVPAILKLHTKHFLPSLKTYEILSFMTIYTSARVISTSLLQVSFIHSALADQILLHDVNWHIEAYK